MPTRSRSRSSKPFAVLDEATLIGTPPVGGGAVFEQALRNAGVPRVIGSANSGDPGLTSRQYSVPAAEFIGKQLKGGKAEYAGEGMQDQPRKFGVIYSSNFDIDFFKAQLKKYGVTLASEVSYTVAPGDVSLQTSSPEIDQQIPALITKLKAAGVNNLIMMATHSVATTASKVMKSQEWFPEITVTSFPYTDLDILLAAQRPGSVVTRVRPGLVPPRRRRRHPHAERRDVPVVLGHRPGHALGRFELAARRALLDHPVRGTEPHQADGRRGPRPAAESERGRGWRVQRQRVHVRGAASAADGGVAVRGAALAWWNPNEEGPGNYNLSLPGKGEYMYLDGAKRYVPGTFPKAKKKFFDTENSTGTFPALPASEPKWPTYPCPGCPSSGNSSITASTGQA